MMNTHLRVHIHRVNIGQQLREMKGRCQHLSLRPPPVAASEGITCDTRDTRSFFCLISLQSLNFALSLGSQSNERVLTNARHTGSSEQERTMSLRVCDLQLALTIAAARVPATPRRSRSWSACRSHLWTREGAKLSVRMRHIWCAKPAAFRR